MRSLCYVGTVLILGAALLAGCSGEEGIEGAVPVTGEVTYQGNPVEGATVTFGPVAGGRSASGRTDADGRFELQTLKPGDGALPGKYKVTISKIETTSASAGMTDEEMTKAVYAKGAPRMPPKPQTKHLLPEKYERAATSGLEKEVKAGEENHFKFDLT